MFEACVYKVFIASPSDAAELRQIAREVIHQWNNHAEEDATVLLPVMWETDTAPGNDSAQEIINREALNRSDLVIAIWRHKWGMGTEEEVERSVQDNSREVMQYFSDEKAPPELKNNELHNRLNEYREKIKLDGRPYYGVYDSPEDFREKLTWQLDKKIRQLMEQSQFDISDFSSYELEILAEAKEDEKIVYQIEGRFTVDVYSNPNFCKTFPNSKQEPSEVYYRAIESLFSKGILITPEKMSKMYPSGGICFLNPKKRNEIRAIVMKAKSRSQNA